MVLSALILILSTAFFFFYLQATCQRILRQQFDREYSLEAHPETVFLPSSRTISSLFSMGTFSKWPFPDGPLGKGADAPPAPNRRPE